MNGSKGRRNYKRIIFTAAGILLSLFILLLVFVNRFIEPILRDRIHTLIIQGSDSLYTYTLGDLKANFYGGNVEVENLQIRIDSTRYEYLRKRNALPSLTMQLSLEKGSIKGIGLMALLFGKKIRIEEIISRQADIKLTRHIRPRNVKEEKLPMWKAIQPKIKSIYIGRIKLDGIKLLYKNEDSSESVKLQFDRCDALFDNILIDSVSSFDTTRIGFTKSITMKFNGLKYRTSDSSYKMKAKSISYSSDNRTLEVDSFKLQPTLDKEDFYEATNRQQSLYYIEFEKVSFVNTRLDHFIHYNVIDADSVIFEKPEINIYNDKTVLIPDYESKIGKYPQQQLLNARVLIRIKNILGRNGKVEYTEKDGKTLKEGSLVMDKLQLQADNITNDRQLILRDAVCRASLNGQLLGSSPLSLTLKFYLDSTNGRYDASGSVKDVTAAQLNTLSLPLANVMINSFFIHNIDFEVRGEDYGAAADVRMRYNNLALTIRKTDEETGETTTKKFITKILNRFAIWPDNPGGDGIERVARNSRVARLTTQAFFAVLWKAVFEGMQNIMMRSGRYE